MEVERDGVDDLMLEFASMNMCCDTSDDEIVCGICGHSYCDNCTVQQCEICVAVSSMHNLCPKCATVVYEFDTTICHYHLRELMVSMGSPTMNDQTFASLAFCNTHSKFIIYDHRWGHLSCDVQQIDDPSGVVRDLVAKYPQVWK